MLRHLALLATLLLASPNILAAADNQRPDRPNILFIVADDLGWSDVGWHGGFSKTPNMDKLVREGIELDQHYVQPVCTPTRTALMSGRYPGRFGPHALAPSNLRAMPLGTVTLAAALKSVGYQTYQAGKWHLGARVEWGPNQFGFDHGYGTLTGAADPWTHKYRTGPYEDTWHRDGKLFAEDGNATELIAAEALRRDRPDLAIVYVQGTDSIGHVFAPFAPPRQLEVSEEDFERYQAVPARYFRQVDQMLGKYRALAESAGAVLMLASDHGFTWGEGRPTRLSSFAHATAAKWHRKEGMYPLGAGHRPVGLDVASTPRRRRPGVRDAARPVRPSSRQAPRLATALPRSRADGGPSGLPRPLPATDGRCPERCGRRRRGSPREAPCPGLHRSERIGRGSGRGAALRIDAHRRLLQQRGPAAEGRGQGRAGDRRVREGPRDRPEPRVRGLEPERPAARAEP